MVRRVVVASLSPALGPVLVGSLLLLPAGFAKVERPAPTALALARAGLRVPDWAVRLFGLGEAALAMAVVAEGGPAGIALAVLYLAFAVFTARQVVVARRTGETADCGCFGDDSAPVGWTHVAVNLTLAAAAVTAAAVDVPGFAEAREDGTWPLAAVYAMAAVAAMGVEALLTDLPRLRALRSEPAEG